MKAIASHPQLLFAVCIAWLAATVSSSPPIRPLIVLAGPTGNNMNNLFNATLVGVAQINAQNLTQTAAFSNLQVQRFTLTGNLRSDRALVDSIASNPSGIPLLAILLQYSDIAVAFGEKQIPVAFIGNFAGAPSNNQFVFQMIPAFALNEFAYAAAFKLFNWTNVGIFTTLEFLQTSQRAARILNNAGVQTQFIQLSPTVENRKARLRLEHSKTQVVFTIADRGNIETWTNIRGFTSYETFVWQAGPSWIPGWIGRWTFRPSAWRDRFYPVYSHIDADRTYNQFAVSHPANMTRYIRFHAAAASFGIIVPPAFPNSANIYAYDACLIMARALATSSGRGHDVFNTSVLARAILTDRSVGNDGPEGQLIASPYRFQERTGERIGAFDVLNLYSPWQNNSGMIIKIGEVNFPDGPRGALDGWVDFNAPGLRYASRTMTSPIPSTKAPRIVLGFLYLNTTGFRGLPSGTHPQAPAWLIWLEVAKLAAADATTLDAPVLKGFEINITSLDCLGFESDTIARCAGGLVAQGSMALLSPLLSRHVRTIAPNVRRSPLVGWSTSDDDLADPASLDQFLRLSASDYQISAATTDLFEKFGWSRCCLLYSSTVESTALQGSLNRMFDESNITVVQRVSLSEVDVANASLSSSLEVIKRADCRVIVSALDSDSVSTVLLAARNLSMIGFNSSYTWILNEMALIPLWMHNEGISRSSAFDPSVLVGSFILKTRESLSAEQQAQQLSHHIKSKLGYNSLPPFSEILYDAVRVSARGVAAVLSPEATDDEAEKADILDGISNSTFVGMTGAVSFTDRNRGNLHVHVLNFQLQGSTPAFIGQWTHSRGLILDSTAVFSDGSNQVPPDRYVHPRATMEFSSPGAIAVVVFAIVLVVIYIASAILLWVRQDIKAVRTSSPVFLVTICFGLSLACLSVLFWFGDPSPHTCRSRLWLAFLGCSIAYCSVLAKNWRLWYLFYESSMKIFQITNQQLFGIVASTSLPLVISLVVWSGLPPGFIPSLQFDASGSFQWRTCSAGSNDIVLATISFGYMGLLMIAGAALSFKTRKLPSKVKESVHIAIATYFILFISASGIIVGFILSADPLSFSFLIVICILAGSLGFFLAVIGPKLLSISRHIRGVPSSKTTRGSGTSATGGSRTRSNTHGDDYNSN